MDKLLKIIFSKKSPSKNLKEALHLANKLNGATEGDNITIELTVTEVFNLWEYVNRLLPLVDKWKSFEIYYRERLCVVHKDYRALFYAIQQVRSCYHQMQDDPIDFEKCDDKWGCIQLNKTSLELIDYKKKWFDFGSFQDTHTWIIDKALLLNALEIEISQKYLSVCPAFSKRIMRMMLEKLPKEIKLDGNWEIEYATRVVEGVVTDVPVSIEYSSAFKDFNNKANKLLGDLGIGREN